MDSKVLYLISKLDESLFKHKNDLDNYFKTHEVLFFSYEANFEGCEYYRLFTCNKMNLEVDYYFLNENFNIKAESYNKTRHITGSLTNIDLRHVLSDNNRLMPESIKQRKSEICEYYKIFIEKTILERTLAMRKNKDSEMNLKVNQITNNNNNNNLEKVNKVIKI